MNILVLGAGSMGLLFGAALAGEKPGFLEKDEEKIVVIRENGYSVTAAGNETWFHPRISSRPLDFSRPDLLIVTVKTYDALSALETAKSLIGPDTYVLTLQNGLGNVEKITEYAGKDHIIAGTTTHAAYTVGKNRVQHTGRGDIVAGFASEGDENALAAIAACFAKGGFMVKTEKKINNALWTKALVNAAINPLTALTGKKNGELLIDNELLFFMEKIIEEGEIAARLEGVDFLYPDMLAYTKSVAEATADNFSSMLMDINNGRPTEICAINGEICRKGLKSGLYLPYNKWFQDLVLALENKKCYTSD